MRIPAVILLAVCTAIAASTQPAAARAKAPKPKAVLHKPTVSRADRDFGKCFTKYSAMIGKLVSERASQDSEDIADFASKVKKLDRKIAESEPTLLKRLRKSAKATDIRYRPFGLYGPAGPHEWLCEGASDASAKLFIKLRDEGVVEDEYLVYSLVGSRLPISKLWIPYLGRVVRSTDRVRVIAALTLYKLGVSRDTYRSDLLKVVDDKTNDTLDMADMLHSVLFDIGTSTYDEKPVVTPENNQLMRKYASKTYSPRRRVICADYAAQTGEPSLATEICGDILMQRYKAQPDDDVSDYPDSDYHLLDAKTEAFWILLYKVKTKEAFKLVYDRAYLFINQNRFPDSVPANMRGYFRTGGELVIMEIDCAGSLIREIVGDLRY